MLEMSGVQAVLSEREGLADRQESNIQRVWLIDRTRIYRGGAG